jgi:hypothetical protein
MPRVTELLAICACLTGCAATTDPEMQSLVLFVGQDVQSAECTVHLQNERIALSQLDQHLQSQRGVQRAVIHGPVTLPYRCIGGLIYVLQSRGFQVEFRSSP